MSNYYEYQDVKLLFCEALRGRGWEIYGYKADNSDPMTDYYDPAHWYGVAEKNGFVFCCDVYGAEEAQEIKVYTNENAVDSSIYSKIEKLQSMTEANGATVGEAQNALKMIENLKNKLSEQEKKARAYKVVGVQPGHMANPPRCNYHLEKDGNYILKGNGILKYSTLWKYYHYSHYKKSLDLFKSDRQKWIDDFKLNYRFDDVERALNSNLDSMEKIEKLNSDFEKLINRIDSEAGVMLGEADETVTYEKVIVTKHKEEVKAVETAEGSIRDGQCFVLKANFNYCRRKGFVYRMHDEGEYFIAYKLNDKLTKECKGYANAYNRFHIEKDKFSKWIEQGAIAWVNLEKVRTPYTVEKVVKKVNKQQKNTDTEPKQQEQNNEKLDYSIIKDTDTRDNSVIYVVKIKNSLTREEYSEVNKKMRNLGGYYSKFKHGFLFRENPENLNFGT